MSSWRERRAAAPGPLVAGLLAAGPLVAGLLVAGLLLALGRPAAGAVAAPGAAGATASGSAADLLVTVTVTPNRPGPNTVSVLAASSRRPPPSPVTGVELRLPGQSRVRLAPVAPGRYVGSGRLDRAGTVTAGAVVVRPSGPVTVPLSWAVGPALAGPAAPAAPALPAADRGSRAGPLLTVAVPPLVGVLLLGVARRRSRRRKVAGSAPPVESALEGVG